MANLTLEKRLVQNLGRPRAEPGHHLVVYKETDKGAVFYKFVPRSERFRPRLFDRWLGSFIGYAVAAGTSLRHRFAEQLDTGIGDNHDIFNLHVTLSYQVADPQALVERLSEDPLGTVENEIRNVFKRRASELRYGELLNERYDIESHFLRGVEDETKQSALERFQDLAREFGIGLDRVEVTRTYSIHKFTTGREVVESQRETRVRMQRAWGENQVAAIEAQGARQRQLLAAIGQRLVGMAGDAEAVKELRNLVEEVSRDGDQFTGILGSKTAPDGTPDRKVLETANSHGPLGNVLQRMLEAIGGLEWDSSKRTVLAGRILHILAELCLGKEPTEDRLETYLAELATYCTASDLVQAIESEDQRHFFGQFRNAEIVRRELAELVPGVGQ